MSRRKIESKKVPVRCKYYEDYGMSELEAKMLIAICKGNEEYAHIIKECAEQSRPDIAEYITKSIVYGMSYERFEAKGNAIPMCKSDFYGYRRMTLALFKERMRYEE